MSKETEGIYNQKMRQCNFYNVQFKLLLLLLVLLVPSAGINERPHCQEKEAHLPHLLSCSFPLSTNMSWFCLMLGNNDLSS